MKEEIKINKEDEIRFPVTKINMIKDIYPLVVKIMHVYGIAFNDYYGKIENIPYGNRTKPFFNKQTNQWELKNILWAWEDALLKCKQEHTKTFQKLKLTIGEEYAIAVKLNYINIYPIK